MTPTERKDALALARRVVMETFGGGRTNVDLYRLAALVLYMYDRARTRLIPGHAALVEYGNAARLGTPDHVAWQRLRAAAIRAAELERSDTEQNGAAHDGQ